MKKIAIIGTHGVGKTTLCNGLATCIRKQGKTAVIVSENVRECPLPIHDAQGLATTQWIIGRQLQAEMEATIEKPDFILCDRSMLDPMVYLLYNSPNFRHDELFEYVKDYTISYDKMILIRPSCREITPDSFRSVDKEYQYNIHSLFMALTLSRADVIDSQEIFDCNPREVSDGWVFHTDFEDESLCQTILGLEDENNVRI